MTIAGNSVDWVAVATVTSAVLVAVATGFAAFAASRSAKATKESANAANRYADLTRQAALLATIPRVVPWVTKAQVGTAMNRGASEAFNLSWTITALEDGSIIHQADRQDVLPVDKTQPLWTPDSAVAANVARYRAGKGIEIVCKFWSLGDEFTVRREVGKLRNNEPRLYDESGQEVKIGL